MAAYNVESDRKAEAGSGSILVAGVIEPEKRAKDRFALIFGNPGAVIVNRNRQTMPIASRLDVDLVAMANGIADKVDQTPLERIGFHRGENVPVALKR